MSPKRQRFVDEYLIDLNATQAAIRAGYSAKSAYAQGQRLLKNAEIAAAIRTASAARSQRTEVTQDYVLTNLREIVERCMQRAPVMEFDKIEKAYVQSQDEDGKDIWTFDARNAVASLGLLGKHLAMFTDRTEVTTSGATGVLRVNAPVGVEEWSEETAKQQAELLKHPPSAIQLVS